MIKVDKAKRFGQQAEKSDESGSKIFDPGQV